MANHGRSPDGQYPPGRGRPAGPPPSAWGTGAQAQVRPESPEQLPPPEWADSAVGRRWTTSWRVPPTGGRPRLARPQDRPGPPPPDRPAPPPGRREAGPLPRRDTGAWPAPGTRPGPADTTRTTGGIRTTSGPRTTSGTPTTSAPRTTGAMRTAKPIAPGTGKARIVLPIVVLAVIALGVVGVGYLWWRNTVFMHSPGALLTDVGEVLGLLAGYGVVVLVALMSR